MIAKANARKLVLIIEDESDFAELLDYHLQRHGYDTLIAADGLEGMNEALQRYPDLVILDLMLPKLHGLQVCRLLKSSPVARHIPILILSALESRRDKLKGFELGADDYVGKTSDISELLARVDVLLRGDAEGERPEVFTNL
jgi:two-component system phosphate regulon response regulator PhoB